MLDWNPALYRRYEDERTRPAQELLARVPLTEVARVVDLGCGPGNSTGLLVQRFPAARVSGLDSSADMIAAARKRLPDVQFEVAEIDKWTDQGPFDVIFANAVLQWVPDHASLLPALASRLSDGGSLAIQMPDNLNEPSHRLMREVAANGPWASKLADAAGQRTDMASASEYFSMLRPHCARVDVWRTTYHHQLRDGAAGVVEWFKGSGLIPFLSPLTEEERAQYLQRYLAEVAKAYPALADGSVLLPFPRLFIVATR